MIFRVVLMRKNNIFMNKCFGWLILLFVLLVSCSSKDKYNQILHRADSLMNANDDSVNVSIKILDETRPLLSDFSKAQRMRYELLYHKAMNKAFIPFTSDSVMLEVADYYENHGSANDKMLVYYVLGCVYRDIHEAPTALEYYNRAVEYADTTSSDCDYATLCRIYSQMGVLFDIQHLPYQELASFGKASKFALLAKDTLNAIRYYYNKIGAYACLNQEDSIAITNLRAAKLFKKHGYLMDSKIAYGCNFEYYLRKKRYKEAKQAFEAYQSTNFKGNSNYEDSYAGFLYQQGLYYLFIQNKNDSAYLCFKQSLEQSKSYVNRATAARGLALFYSKMQKPKLSAKYALLSSEYNDSDLVLTRKDQLQQLQAMYDYNRNKKMAIQAKLIAEHRKNVIYIIVICCLLFFALFYAVIRKYIARKNQRIAIVLQLYNDSLQQLNSAKLELEKIHDMNDKTLVSLVSEKERLIQKLQTEVKKYEVANIEHSILELDKQLENSSIYKKFIYFEKHPQIKITKEDWEKLEDTVEELVYGFAGLKQKLNKKEYYICLLIKLHFSPSTISHFLSTSLSDISLSRQRMLSKVCGKIGKAKEFDEYIRHLL